MRQKMDEQFHNFKIMQQKIKNIVLKKNFWSGAPFRDGSRRESPDECSGGVLAYDNEDMILLSLQAGSLLGNDRLAVTIF
jgi:hypothetical protein